MNGQYYFSPIKWHMCDMPCSWTHKSLLYFLFDSLLGLGTIQFSHFRLEAIVVASVLVTGNGKYSQEVLLLPYSRQRSRADPNAVLSLLERHCSSSFPQCLWKSFLLYSPSTLLPFSLQPLHSPSVQQQKLPGWNTLRSVVTKQWL